MSVTKGPHPADIFAGQILRQMRLQANLSQENLAEAIGITFQQLQKYETGKNRMSASRISEIAKVLLISPGIFFEKSLEWNGYEKGYSQGCKECKRDFAQRCSQAILEMVA